MSSFLYYIPKLAGLNDEGLKRAGLFERIGPSRDVTPSQIQGPDKGRGILFRDAAGGPFRERLLFNADAQVWRREVIRDHKILTPEEPPAYWVGFWKSNPPGPENLRRYAAEEMFEGYETELGDGRKWVVPRGRIFDKAAMGFQTPWPSKFGFDDDGNLTRSISQNFREHEEILKLSIAASEPMRTDDFDLLAARILGINYRISENEVIALNLLDTHTSRQTIHAYLDYFAILEQLEAEKKSQVGMEPGNTDATDAGREG
jgi:hypothetical protein